MKNRTALISFLGKSRIAEDGRYREATYRLPDGTQERSRLISLTLAYHLRPDRLVIMGTPGSMWEPLLTNELELEAGDDAVYEVIEATGDGQVSDEQLAPFARLLSERLGMEVSFVVIPYGRDATDQQNIVESMASAVEGCDEVHIDVTHGLRHLPMVALSAAQLMQQLQGKTIKGLHYGALELSEEGVAPVLALDGLLVIDRWVRALHIFDKDGDYGVFVPLLDGLVEQEAIDQLANAAFLERINDVRRATKYLQSFLKHLDSRQFERPIERLFIPALQNRISWSLEGGLGLRQVQLARRYLESNDYLRAVLLAWEALITHQTTSADLNPDDYDDRQEGNKLIQDNPSLNSHYKVLRNLRNTIAHGERSRMREVKKLLGSEQRLRAYLQEFLDKLATHIRE